MGRKAVPEPGAYDSQGVKLTRVGKFSAASDRRETRHEEW